MEAAEYLQERARMTKAEHGHCLIPCKDCRLHIANNGTNYACYELERLHPEKAIEIVQQWAKEHPRKTYAQDFFEKFPHAPALTRNDGMERPVPCRNDVYQKQDEQRHCYDCMGCWHEPMEDK